MKNKSIFKYELSSTIFIIILGTLLHFTFEWSGKNQLIGIFSAVNESIWEHLKLLFFPMLITIIIGHFYLKKCIPYYLCIKTRGLLLALSFIVVFFYTYSGILGSHIAIVDIGSFIVATILGEYYTYKNIRLNASCNNLISIIILLVLSFLFIIFTFKPLPIGIFKVM